MHFLNTNDLLLLTVAKFGGVVITKSKNLESLVHLGWLFCIGDDDPDGNPVERYCLTREGYIMLNELLFETHPIIRKHLMGLNDLSNVKFFDPPEVYKEEE